MHQGCSNAGRQLTEHAVDGQSSPCLAWRCCSAFECLGVVVMMACRQPMLALVTVVVTPTLSRLLRGIVVRSTRISLERQQAAAQALEFASERLRHVQTVQVFDQQQREAEAFRQLSEGGYRLAQKFALFQGIVEGCGRLAVNFGTLALLAVGGWFVLQGHTSVGTVLAAQVQCLFLSVGLSAVAASLGELGKAIGALERIAALAASSSRSSSSSSAAALTPSPGSAGLGTADASGGPTLMPRLDKIAGHVEFRDVWFRYPGREDWALGGFSLEIEPGSTVALVGASGGGKSTVAALLLGLYQPQKGSVTVDWRPLSSPEYMEALRPHMAAVLQQPMLMQGTVAEVVRYGRPEATLEVCSCGLPPGPALQVVAGDQQC